MSKLPVLKRNNEFHRVYTKGRYAVTGSLVVYFLPNRSDCLKIGITASKKVGNSVSRNRIRRLIRENIRFLFSRINRGIDLVIVARKSDPSASLDSIGKEIRFLLKKLDIIDKEVLS